MLTDALATFIFSGAPFSLVGGLGINLPTNPYDLAGVGAGQAVTNIIGNVTKFGTDFGVGGFKPEFEVLIGTALTTSTSATLNLALQAAADNGSNQPSTWVTQEETGPMAAADLTAGQVIMRLAYPPAWTPGLKPRFIRLLAQVPAATAFTAGTIAFAGIVLARDDYQARYVAKNYTVA